MRPELFDNLARAVGRATSRRKALAILAGGAGAAALPGLLWGLPRAGAEETGGAALAAGPVCNPSNFITASSYEELDTYVRVCGVACTPGDPGSFLPFAGGCTNFGFTHDPPLVGPMFVEEHPFRGWCATAPVSVNWRLTDNTSARLDITFNGACCQDTCDAEIRRWEAEVDVHEQAHRFRNIELIARANVTWESRPVTGCAGREELAPRALRDAIDRQVAAERLVIETTQQSDPEPSTPYKPFDPVACVPGSRCSSCRNGTCVDCPADKVCCPPSGPKWCCEKDWACCPLPLRQGKEGCCPPAKPVCCPPALGGGCCPISDPVCYFDGRIPSCRPEDPLDVDGGAAPVRQENARVRGR